jgi:hypothetical protein
MATVRHLGLFALQELTNDNKPSRCPQTSAAFGYKTLGNTFPIHAATIANSPYVPMSLERAMLWNWRVKKWKADVNITFRTDGPEDTASIETSFFIQSAKTEEKELVCGSGQFSGEAFFYQDPDGAGPLNTPGDWQIDATIGAVVTSRFPSIGGTVAINASQSVRVSDDESPIFYLPAQININVGGLGFAALATSGILIEHVAGSNLPIDWSINDGKQTYSKPFRFGDETAFLGGSVDISIAEYWPYDPNDGAGPIYNTATGKQLRPSPA